MIINKVNIDKWLFDYFEGNLSTHEKIEIERFIELNPEFEIDLDAWEDSYNMSQEVPVYNIPSSLYKKSFLVEYKFLVTSIFLLSILLLGGVYSYIIKDFDYNTLLTKTTANKKYESKKEPFSYRFINSSEVQKGKEREDEIQLSEKPILLEIEKLKREAENKEYSYLNEIKSVEKQNDIVPQTKLAKSSRRYTNYRGRNNKIKVGVLTKNKVRGKILNPNITQKKQLNKRVKGKKAQALKSIFIDRNIEPYYKQFKKENLTEKYKYLSYKREGRSQNNFESKKKKKRKKNKGYNIEEKPERKLEYFDNIAIIGVLFDDKGKIDNPRKISFIDKLKRKELALVNTHDPIFVTDNINPIENNVALTGGLNMTRFKINAIDRWRGTLNSQVGGVFTADTYFSKIKAGVGLEVVTKSMNNLGIYSSNIGVIYSQRIEISENNSINLGGKYSYTESTFNGEKLKATDGNVLVEIEQGNSFLVMDNKKEYIKNEQNNLTFGAWYDGSYFYGGINVDNIKIKKSENNNANQFVEYINPVKFAVQLGTDYRRNAYSALIISPQLNYIYQNDKSEIWLGSSLKYKNFLTGIGASTSESYKISLGAQGDRMRFIYGFNFANSVAEAKFYETHEISFRYILRSKNNWKKNNT